jgi:hypothetical protein
MGCISKWMAAGPPSPSCTRGSTSYRQLASAQFPGAQSRRYTQFVRIAPQICDRLGRTRYHDICQENRTGMTELIE